VRVVVDASLLVALLTSPGSEADGIARRLMGEQLHAPDHVAVEVTSAVRRLRLAGKLGETEALLALSALWDLPIQLWPQRVLNGRTWALAANVGAYDAGYVALAERLDAPLLTADARLGRASGPVCRFEVFDGDHR